MSKASPARTGKRLNKTTAKAPTRKAKMPDSIRGDTSAEAIERAAEPGKAPHAMQNAIDFIDKIRQRVIAGEIVGVAIACGHADGDASYSIFNMPNPAARGALSVGMTGMSYRWATMAFPPPAEAPPPQPVLQPEILPPSPQPFAIPPGFKLVPQ